MLIELWFSKRYYSLIQFLVYLLFALTIELYLMLMLMVNTRTFKSEEIMVTIKLQNIILKIGWPISIPSYIWNSPTVKRMILKTSGQTRTKPSSIVIWYPLPSWCFIVSLILKRIFLKILSFKIIGWHLKDIYRQIQNNLRVFGTIPGFKHSGTYEIWTYQPVRLLLFNELKIH